MAARKIAAYSATSGRHCASARGPRSSAPSGPTRRGAGDEATKEAQYVVTIADINAAYRLLSDSAYLGAIEHAAPLEQLVLIALCARSRARASRRRRRSRTSRGASRGSSRSRATRATRRARRRTASCSRSSTASPTRLLATEHLKQDDRTRAAAEHPGRHRRRRADQRLETPVGRAAAGPAVVDGHGDRRRQRAPRLTRSAPSRKCASAASSTAASSTLRARSPMTGISIATAAATGTGVSAGTARQSATATPPRYSVGHRRHLDLDGLPGHARHLGPARVPGSRPLSHARRPGST